MYMNVELAQIKCEDVKYIVLYYEEDTDRCLQTLPSNELFVVNDPELELDNIIELKNRKLEHSKQMGVADMHLKPDTDNKSLLTKIVNYPVTRALKREEQALMWKYRYYLTQNKKALTKFLQCFDLNLEFEGKMLMELMLKWQPMDVEDALELLGSKYKAYPKIRSYAVSRLTLASNHDLILYLLQLVQALRYETFSPTQQRIKSNESTQNNTNNKSQSRKGSLSSSQASVAATTPLQDNNNQLLIDQQQQQQDNNVKSLSKRTFELNLRTFLLERATQNEVVALSLYWFVKVEIKDTKTTLPSAANTTTTTIPSTATTSTTDVLTNSSSTTTIINTISSNSLQHSAGQPDSTPPPHPPPPSSSSSSSSAEQHSNFHIFMSELLDSLRNGNQYARNTYDNIINQEKFLKALNDVVKSTIKESGGRDQKVTKLRQFMADTAASSSNFDLVNFPLDIPLISDPAVKINATQIEKTTMFKSALMPCKFCFKTTTQEDEEEEETTTTYSVIYKIGDDLRQDQLVLQMIALMDKLLKQENLDLKLTPYKVVATGIKEGFLQFVDAMPMSEILKEYRSIKEYLKRHNPGSDQQPQDKYGMTADAMDNYVRSTAGYMVITYILGVGDRHYDNILITKCGKIVHIDFGYILGREPKPFQPIVKWTKDMADGMGGKYGPDGKENKEYEDFKKYCYNAFLHLRRHANLILNLFSLMVDANIPDIALEPDKTVKKLIDRFKLDVSDEQASGALLKEIENNYDTIVGSITDIIHGYAVAQK
jgi:phosphatidylinositol 3-kinase